MSNILKQNGSNGKIMRAQTSGKVLKQNYNFGLKSNIPSRSYYLEIPTLIGVDIHNWSISLVATRRDDEHRHPKIFCSNINGSAKIDVFEQMALYPNDGNKSSFIDGQVASVTTIGRRFLTINNSYTSFIVSELFIAKGGVRSTSPSISDIDNVLIYDRNISIEEHQYIYNNGLGNEPLNSNGIKCYLTFEKPLISGLDIIHEDMSGNGNHAVYKGLPAGTPEEQLQFVVNNLLVLW